MHLLLKALTRTPLPLLYAYACIACFVAFHVLRWRRRYVECDIATALPDASAADRATTLRVSYRNAADTMMEAFWGCGADDPAPAAAAPASASR